MSEEGRSPARPSIRPVWWWSGLAIWAIALLLGGAVLALHLGWGPTTEVGALVRDRLVRAEAQGASLLLLYALGMTVPFVATGVAFTRMAGAFRWVKRHYRLLT